MAAPQASSRLELLQARFQQKQLQEKEQKLLQLYDQQQQRAYQVVQRGSAGSNNPNHGSTVTTVTRSSSSTHTTSTSHGGKVRQMFDERRQTGVKGIDRSYPLEPLENKPRKQTNGLASQRNGNFTVSRQSVTVKRVARADVNSNLNGGKPVISYHEEVTRESFGSPLDDDKDEFGSENHLSRYANGNGEVRIEEVLDSSVGDRMPGKHHLMEFEEGTKQRVRNDLDGEEFPEDHLVDVPDKLPKRTVTRKLSQAEARLERFKNANAKRTTPPRNTTTTTSITKKRSEPLFPSKSTSSNTEANRSRLSQLLGGKSTRRSPTPTTVGNLTISRKDSSRSPSRESRRSVSSIQRVRSRLSSPELIRSTMEEIDKPEFFCVESDRSATTYSAKPTISWTNKTKRPLFLQSGKTNKRIGPVQSIRKKRSDKPEFFCKESETSATTYSLRPRPTGTKNSTTGTNAIGRKSRENDSQKGSRKPKYFYQEGDRSATTMSLDAVDTRVQSVRPERIVRRPGESVQSLSSNCKATSGSDVKSKPRITRLSENEKQVYRGARTSPAFFGPESEKSATTMTVVPETIRKSRAITSPETRKRVDSGSKKFCFNHTGASVSLKDLGKESPRSGSPKYFDRPTERKGIDTKAPVRRSPSPEKLIEKRESSPEFFCRESEKSATTISLKPKVSNGSIGGRSKSPRSEQQKATSRNGGTTRSDRKSVNQYQSTRRMSKSPENSSPFGNRNGTCPKGSGHVLRSIGLIRDVINRQDQTRNTANLSRKQRTLDKKRASIKSDEGDGVSLGKVGKKSSVGGNNSRPPTPANSYKLTTPGSSPRSFSSAEGDAEIQEITLSHRYVHGDKVDDMEKEAGDRNVGRVVAKTYSKSCSQKGSSSSENSKSDSPATYSVGKSCKKRGSLLQSNIFVPICTRTREQGSTSRRRCSSDSKSSCEAGRTVSLRQITRNKSQAKRSTNASPTPPSLTASGKLPFSMASRRASLGNVKREITSERKTSGSPRQTSASPTGRLRNRESPINSSSSIFGESPTILKKCRSGKSPPVRAPISPSSGRRLQENCSTNTDGADTLRSTDLVRRAMDDRDERGSSKISLGGNKNQGGPETGGTSIEDHHTVDSKVEAFDEEKHKVVKKDKAVYPGLAIAKLKNLTTSSREIEKMNIGITDSTGKGNESTDYVRTDSVESALKRFDSIGGESTRTFALGTSSQCNLHTSEEHGSIVTETKAKRGSEETISLKGHNQQKATSPLKIKTTSSKLTLRKTPTTLSKTPKSAMKGTIHSSVAKILKSPDIRSKKKFANARDSIEIVRISAKSRPPGCKRRLFQDSDSGEEMKSASSKKTSIMQKQMTSQKIIQDASEPDSSVSLKQLRSIKDIRKSMKSSSSGNSSSSRLSIIRRKESLAKPAIAYKVRQSPATLKLESRSVPISSVYRSRTTSCWKSGGSSPGAGDLFLKDRTPLSRITKSPSPEPVPRKVAEAVRTTAGRRSVPPSPSKSPEAAPRAPSESKATRRLVAAGSKRSTITTAKKSPDVTDGPENGLHPQESVAEAKRENIIHTPGAKKADAFVIDFDEPTAREREPAQARKPLPRKQSAEKLTSPTTPARPPSSVSSTSSGSPHGSKSKMSGRAKSKSSMNAASTSRTSAAMKNTGSFHAADNLMACKICGRHFATDRVRLHEEICSKTAQKKRKQFDAMLFRVRGTELEPFMRKGLIKKNDSRSSKAEVKSDWRKKHEDFINAIRSAKQVQAHLAAGGKLSDLPPPPPSDYSDYIQCPHCGRKFNQAAAERHIPKCENMLHNKATHSRPPKPRR